MLGLLLIVAIALSKPMLLALLGGFLGGCLAIGAILVCGGSIVVKSLIGADLRNDIQ